MEDSPGFGFAAVASSGFQTKEQENIEMEEKYGTWQKLQRMTMIVLPAGISTKQDPSLLTKFHHPKEFTKSMLMEHLQSMIVFPVWVLSLETIKIKLWLLYACRSSLPILQSLWRSFALEQGVLLARELQLPRVIFESNSLAVIQAINDKPWGTIMGTLFREFCRFVVYLSLAISST
ncbi:hypothetical protein SO802_031675 [Lithocarpus litseifolius]|uniref:RNase H type-1 domain-containing protein n=1 Tax=Lithocarpus litseifolius TaxID=425828 RepID=A0AAW2BL54_9ROSI